MKNIFTKIKFTSAGAGSGKTTELTEILYQAVVAGKVDPRTVIAVTFTTHAAAELVQRVRQKLLEKGQVELAHAMESARIGTVHSVCAELLREYCYEQGASPEQRTITEDEEDILFSKAVAESMDGGPWQTIAEVSLQFGMGLNDFRDDVIQLGRLARGNAIEPKGVVDAIPGSLKQITIAFGNPTKHDITTDLRAALAKFIKAHPAPPQETKVAIEGHAEVIQLLEKLSKTGKITWKQWHSLSKLNLGAKAKIFSEEISEIAANYVSHPEYQDAVAALTRAVHEAAASAMSLYSDRKKALGLIDFTDMEHQFLLLLDRKDVSERLKEEVSLLYVDEFQDTNPIQLAIFMRLAEFSQETTWVGDPKQSVYAFRGADPQLTQAILASVPDTNLKILGKNYRSRKELVEFTSSLFEQAFAPDGLTAKQVILQPQVKFDCSLPALQVWRPTEKTIGKQIECVSEQIQSLLKSNKTVTDKSTNEIRALRGGDIAVLLRKNDRIPLFYTSLSKHGIAVTCKVGGVASLPEATLALAAYRFAIDSSDSVAASELTLLMGIDRDQWIQSVMKGEVVESWHPSLKILSELRSQISELTPSEILDRAIVMAQVEDRLNNVSRSDERTGNLALLRIQARQYEDFCSQTGAFCTPVGLLEYLENVDSPGESERSADSVQLMTYHGSKGLEWPVVILCDLDDKMKLNSIFDRRIITTQAFAPNSPLENRVVRYLPYVFANNSNPPEIVNENLDACPEEQSLRSASEAQERRLLYVGMTRPRESLIFVLAEKVTDLEGTLLGSLKNAESAPLFNLPTVANPKLLIGGKQTQCEVLSCSIADVTQGTPKETQIRFPTLNKKNENIIAPLLHLSPSKLIDIDSLGKPGEVTTLGKAFSTPSTIDREDLGDAIHSFLACDDLLAPEEERVDMAKNILHRWNVPNALKPNELKEMADRLKDFIDKNLNNGKMQRELPMSLLRGQSQLRGYIDLLVVTDDEVAIVDHKSSYLHEENTEILVKRYANQLSSYKEAVVSSGQYSGKRISAWLHLPVAGKMIRVEL